MAINSAFAALLLAALSGVGAHKTTNDPAVTTIATVAGLVVGYKTSEAIKNNTATPSEENSDQTKLETITDQVSVTTAEQLDSETVKSVAKEAQEEADRLAKTTEAAKKLAARKAQAKAKAAEKAEAKRLEKLGAFGRATEAFKDSRKAGDSIFNSLQAAKEAF